MEEYGIFQILEKLDERDKYHHQLCRIRCKSCGRESIRRYKAHPYQGLLPHKTSYYSIYMSDNYKKENNNE